MDKFKEIRPVVLGIAIKNGKILVSEGYDKVKKQTFYRCLGGGIEFLETSQEALKREYKEELGIDIIVEDFCGISENIFTYQGKNAHELILFYNIKIQDKDFENVDYVDILSNFALTIGKMTQKIVANCDFSRIVNGINKVVQDMIIPLREAYNSSINESLEKIALVGKIDNHKVHTQTRKSDVTKVLTAFEAAEELKSIAKDFNNTAENDTE